MVDSEIVAILRNRYEDCLLFNQEDGEKLCAGVLEAVEQATADWCAKRNIFSVLI